MCVRVCVCVFRLQSRDKMVTYLPYICSFRYPKQYGVPCKALTFPYLFLLFFALSNIYFHFKNLSSLPLVHAVPKIVNVYMYI